MMGSSSDDSGESDDDIRRRAGGEQWPGANRTIKRPTLRHTSGQPGEMQEEDNGRRLEAVR